MSFNSLFLVNQQHLICFVQLIYDTIRAGGSETAGFGDCLKLFPQHLLSSRYCQGLQIVTSHGMICEFNKLDQLWHLYLVSRSGSWIGWIELSGKMAVLARLLSELRCKTDDRIVLVSNYTQVLLYPMLFFCTENLSYLLLAIWLGGIVILTSMHFKKCH